MTKRRADEIVRKVIYRHIEYIAEDLKDCDDCRVAFHIGRNIGMMQYSLEEELEKEVSEKMEKE